MSGYTKMTNAYIYLLPAVGGAVVAVADKMICVQIGSSKIRLSCGNIQRPFVNRVNAQKAKWKIWQKNSSINRSSSSSGKSS